MLRLDVEVFSDLSASLTLADFYGKLTLVLVVPARYPLIRSSVAFSITLFAIAVRIVNFICGLTTCNSNIKTIRFIFFYGYLAPVLYCIGTAVDTNQWAIVD